jgi:hypothetical protein
MLRAAAAARTGLPAARRAELAARHTIHPPSEDTDRPTSVPAGAGTWLWPALPSPNYPDPDFGPYREEMPWT